MISIIRLWKNIPVKSYNNLYDFTRYFNIINNLYVFDIFFYLL